MEMVETNWARCQLCNKWRKMKRQFEDEMYKCDMKRYNLSPSVKTCASPLEEGAELPHNDEDIHDEEDQMGHGWCQRC